MTLKKQYNAGLARKYSIAILLWSVLLGSALFWVMRQESRATLDAAAAAVRADIGKDIIFRKWATSHGGVYVSPTEHTPPNPYLDVPDRDVVTRTGQRLTLMNPAYMLRELQHDFPNEFGIKSHLTSLKLLNPNNAPDAWETAVLHAFEQGDKERVEIAPIDGQPYLRMMRPLVAESGCLKCHGSQGYKVDDIRGGISASVPLAPFLKKERENYLFHFSAYGSIWLVGLIAFGFAYRYERSYTEQREGTESRLRDTSRYTRSLIEVSQDPLVTISAEGKITDVNAATEKATGRQRAELVGTDFSDYFTEPEKARAGYQQVFTDGFVTGYPLTIRHHDGHLTHVLYNANVYRDETGKVQGVFAAAHDITERKNMEDALKESEANIRTLVTHSPVAILLDVGLETDEKIILMNQKFTDLFGYTLSDIPDIRHWWPLAYPDEKYREALRSEWLKKAEKAIQSHSDIEPMEASVTCKDGSIRYVRISLASTGYRNIVTFEDLTERKNAEEKVRLLNAELEHRVAERTAQLEAEINQRAAAQAALAESEARFRAITTHNPDHLLMQDYELRYTFVMNPQLGLTEQDMLGKTDYDFLAQDDAEKLTAMKRRILSSGIPEHIETSLAAKDGTVQYFDGTYIPQHDLDGKVDGLIGYFRNVTERKHNEEQIRRLNDELQQRAQDLEAANKELESFSYSVSHDLRVPLRAISGFSQILLEDYAGKLDEEGTRLFNVVRDNVMKMEQLIDDILKFSRASRTEINYVKIDMGALASEVCAELKSTAGQMLQLEVGHLPKAHGDRAMLRQVFVNLLSNAIKFSRNNASPVVAVSGKIEGNEAVYAVKDNGAGFNMQYADRLFGVFQRLHSTSEFEGTGIGLAIVKRIITRHGGRVWAEGKINEGATIYFTLPGKG